MQITPHIDSMGDRKTSSNACIQSIAHSHLHFIEDATFIFVCNILLVLHLVNVTELIQRNRGIRCDAQIMGRRHEHALDCRQLTCVSQAGKEFRLKIKINWAYRTSHWVPVCQCAINRFNEPPRMALSFCFPIICTANDRSFRGQFSLLPRHISQITSNLQLFVFPVAIVCEIVINWFHKKHQNNGCVSKIIQLNSQEMGKCDRYIFLCMPMMPMSSFGTRFKWSAHCACLLELVCNFGCFYLALLYAEKVKFV